MTKHDNTDLLKKLTALENEAATFGFKWDAASQIMAQIRSELAEIEDHLHDTDRVRLQEEIGDLLHAAFSLCIFCQLDANETLSKSVMKFASRFNAVKQLAQIEGLQDLNGQPFNKLMALWDQAKEMTE
ncbi:MAG TPA: MazG nucleotide pyrophosphohydrolase domain-containing protein [Gammaproteobacteria bacterium]|nr:MazG nucleotide pyrophosphohydrolase domain-containing protein [Gammaproteobacteria bacterium]